MIIIKVMGGLGNQMYQYAFYEKLRSMNREVKLDLSGFDANNASGEKRTLGLYQFPNVSFDVCTRKERAVYVDDSRAFFDRVKRKLFGNRTNIYRETIPYDEAIFEMKDAYLLGYWNCQKYHDDLMPLLREKFAFPASDNPKNEELRSKLAKENSVSIHVRRGDYLESRYAARFGSICTEEYYEAAVNFVKKYVENPHFYVFSDDKEYVKEHYKGEEYTIVDWNEGEENGLFDMMLMSGCRHNICANSTFSKWAALLNGAKDRIRICPLKHTADEKMAFSEQKELYPDWVWIDSDGSVYDERISKTNIE